MSYQVLARKWRPHDFDSMVGQDHVVAALRHALDENRLHHAYLFTGTRGVGKTTLSRILAKCLNCTGSDGKGGVTSKPCGVCDACRAIDEGRFVDYIEMDAASNRSVEEMTALLERAMYAPSNARYKVYMIDEVHMLTTHAFNAMLKTLEEPPEYVKFILATTDPQKVPVTVLSRCLQFNLRNMTPKAVADHMADIMREEGIEAEPAALRLLASGARGSMRDGLSLLDQAIAFSAGKVTLDSVRAMLGVINGEVLADLLDAVVRGDASRAIGIADKMGESSFSYTQAIRDLASLLHRIAMVQRVPESMSGEDPEGQQIKRLALAMTPEEVQLDYQIALQARNDMALAPDEYAGFTMAVLRMLAFKPAGSRVGANVPEKAAPAAEPEPAAARVSPAAEKAMRQAPAAEASKADMPVNEPPEEMVNEPPAEALDALAGEVPWEDGRGEPGAS
ncbi:MAG TPA: DNA polymerase III subunit gamma/tau [Sutterella sp.]|nr:DNA polymerase III subunit gamma/tau [Sutterella sp.]